VTASSLQALLGHIVDYAGLFPPARLDMAPTVRNYAEYLDSPGAWMLGRLILPVARFEEFEREAQALLPAKLGEAPWLISALASPAGDAELAVDLDAISAFNERHADPACGLAVVDVVELRGESAEAIDEALDMIPGELFPFFEMPVASDPRGLLAAVAGLDAGAKVRTGGMQAEAIPSPAHLARFIAASAGAAVPFKATAGLHHPFRHASPALGVPEFGFLNVFLAACLGQLHDLNERDLQTILEAESPSKLRIEDGVLVWGDHSMTTEQVEEARDFFAVSFGSCSFEEPREHLRALGLLDT